LPKKACFGVPSRFIGLVLVATVSIVCSAKATAAAPPGESSDAAAQLQEIVVTARRRDESIDKVPISITALSQRTMDDLSIKTVEDLATVVPGLAVIPPSAAAAQDWSDIGIRGIFSSANGGFVGNAPTTQLYIDETPIAIRQLASAVSKSPWPYIFDLDRVEVLRGPQGTLFGASAMGGAIRFITPQPSLTTSSGTVKADIGYTDGGASPNYEVGAAYGGPIVPGVLGFRVSGWYRDLGGFIDQEDPLSGEIVARNVNKSSTYVIRPAVTWAPSDELSITGAFFMQHEHSDNPDSYWLNVLPNLSGDPRTGFIAQPLTDDLRVSSLSIKYNARAFSLISDTSYLDRTSSAIDDLTYFFTSAFNAAGNFNPFIPGLEDFHVLDENNTATQAWQQEFRVASNDDSSRLKWLGGLYYRHAAQRTEQLQPPDLTPLTEALFGLTSEELFGQPNYVHNGQVLNSSTNYHTTDVAEAVFVDVSWNILKSLKLDVGVRYEHQVVEGQTQFSAGPLLGGTTSISLPDEIENPVTPRASLTYQYTDTGMVYVSAAKGYRPGGGNAVGIINTDPMCQQSLNDLGLTAAPSTFGPDHLWSYELGAKDVLFNQRLSVQGSVYYIKWSEIQTSISLPSCLDGFTANQGHAVSRGFDLQLAAIITPDLKIRASVGYTDAYFPDAFYGAPVNGVPTLLNGAGDKLPNVLPWTAAGNAEYSHDISSLWSDSRFYLRVDYRWLSAAPAGNPAVANYDPVGGAHPNPAYDMLNIRLGLTHGGLDVSAYVNNATRSNPVLGFTHTFTGGQPDIWASGMLRPLTFGVTTWYRF